MANMLLGVLILKKQYVLCGPGVDVIVFHEVCHTLCVYSVRSLLNWSVNFLNIHFMDEGFVHLYN